MAQQKKSTEPLSREARHNVLDELVAMPMAATLAYIRTTGTNVKVSDSELDGMAQELARLITLYSVSEDRQSIVTLGPDDTQGGRFKKAGKVVEFSDGRSAITGLAVTRTSLNAAIDALTRSRPRRA
jgi:hypothetical protein